MLPDTEVVSPRRAPPYLRPSLAVAAALLLVAFGLHAFVSDPDEPDLLYMVPIAIAAGAGGLVYGVGAACIAFALFVGWSAVDDTELNVLDFVARAFSYFVVGIGVGYFADRLRGASQRLRLLIDAAPDGILELDRGGHIIAANSAIEKQFGYQQDELLGQPVSVLLPRPQAPEPDSAVVLDGRTRDGGRIPVELKLGRSGPFTTLVLRDVSERERAEEALRASEERFRTSLDTMLDCFGIYTAVRDERGEIADFRCEYVNEAACELSGLAREEQVGRRLSEYVPSYLTRGNFSQHRQLVETGEPLVIEDYVTRDSWGSGNGTVHVFDVRAVKLGDGFAGAWRDISRRKRAEERLARAKDELERSNASLDEFAHVVSHDLTEPLTTVSLYAQTLGARYPSNFDRSGRALLRRLLDVVERMQERIHAVLAYAEVHREALSRAPVDTDEALGEALKALDASIAASGARVVHAGLPVILGDAGQVQQLFQNLISNAIKFVPEGSRPDVEVAATSEGDAWHFVVSDNGRGIKPRDLRRVFKPFERAADSSRPGHGIGLAVCRSIVEVHGGRIWAESEPGAGSRFHFTLPGADLARGRREPEVSAR
jgi:PAS domain S-box-containing protein